MQQLTEAQARGLADKNCTKCWGTGKAGENVDTGKIETCGCVKKNVKKRMEEEERLKKSGLIVPKANRPNIIAAGNYNKDNDKEAVRSLDKGLIIKP